MAASLNLRWQRPTPAGQLIPTRTST